MIIKTSEFSDVRQRMALELVEELVVRAGGRKDGCVDEKSLDRAAALIDKELANRSSSEKPRALDLDTEELQEVKKQIDDIRSTHFAPTSRKAGAAFCEVIAPLAIVDAGIRACAVAITTAKGRPNGEVFFDDVLWIERIASQHPRAPSERQTDEVKSAYAAIDNGTVSLESLSCLSMFMRHGRGNLLSYGTAKVNGREFEEVFKLPYDPATRDLATSIAAFEKQFEKCGYDRVYILGSNNALYLTLNKKGDIRDITPHARALLEINRTEALSGEIVHVVDVQNSWTEATVGFWKKSVNKLATMLRSAFTGRMEQKIQQIAASVTAAGDPVQPDPVAATTAAAAKPGKKLDLSNTIFTGSVAASVGVASINVPVALSVLTGTAGVITLANTIDYALQRQTKAPIYNALGVVLGKGKR